LLQYFVSEPKNVTAIKVRGWIIFLNGRSARKRAFRDVDMLQKGD